MDPQAGPSTHDQADSDSDAHDTYHQIKLLRVAIKRSNSIRQHLKKFAKTQEYYAKLYRDNGALLNNLSTACRDNDFERINDLLEAAYNPAGVRLEEDPRVVSGSLHSMQTAWRQQFSGNIHHSFLGVIDDMNDNFKDTETVKHYAKLLPVIQSSGVGKSRLLDEVCRHRLGVTFTLRLPHETGFPPGDIEITKFLRSSEKIHQSQHSTMVAFLSSTVAEGMFANLGFRNLMLLFLADILLRPQ